jgi:hypothetical protein
MSVLPMRFCAALIACLVSSSSFAAGNIVAIKGKNGEVHFAQGVQRDGAAVELYVSDLLHMPNGTSCLIAAGTDFDGVRL